MLWNPSTMISYLLAFALSLVLHVGRSENPWKVEDCESSSANLRIRAFSFAESLSHNDMQEPKLRFFVSLARGLVQSDGLAPLCRA